MAQWVNVGARNKSDGSDIPTKKALKDAIAANPSEVELYETTMGNDGIVWQGDDLATNDVKYTVTGPNPYTSRKWYATVERLPSGKITVK